MTSEEYKEHRRKKSREAYAKNPEKFKANVRKYLQKNREKHNERTRKWAEEKLTPERRRKYWVKCAYGVTTEQYDKMLQEQHGLCYICEQPSNKTLCVDHDHETKVVRGLLCQSCNQALGLLRDSVKSLKKAIEYLELPR